MLSSAPHSAKRAAAAKRKKLDEPSAAPTSTQPHTPTELLTHPTVDSAALPGTGNAEAVGKRIRDKFRASIYGVVEQNLLQYRRKGCQVGYISSDEDLRHLSKKVRLVGGGC